MTTTLPLPPDDPRYAGFAYEDRAAVDDFEHLIGHYMYRRNGDDHEFLMRVEERHRNPGRVAHGGMLAALTDLFCSRTIWNHMNRQGGFVTVSLTHEFVGAIAIDRWLLGRCRVRQEGGSLVFIDCEMFSQDKLIGLSRCVMKKLKPRT